MPRDNELNAPIRPYFYAFDFVRFAAAMLVMLNHFADFPRGFSMVVHGEPAAYVFLSPFSAVGAVGVEIFFVISGFVIAASVADRTGYKAALIFLMMRGKRIFPALWISGLIALLARATTGEPFAQLFSYFLRSSTLSPVGPYIDGVVWSLVVEGFFYLLVAFAVLSVSSSRLLGLAIIIGCASIAYNVVCILAVIQNIQGDGALRKILVQFPFKVFLLRHGVFFALGILIWSFRVLKPTRAQSSFALICALFCASELIVLSNLDRVSASVKVMLWTIAIVLLIASSRRKLSPLSESQVKFKSLLKYLGALSYPLYLNHYVLGLVVSYHVTDIDDPVLRFVIASVVVLAASICVLKLEGLVQKRLNFKTIGLTRKPEVLAN